MKLPDIERTLAALETKPQPHHGRHQAKPHHRSATYLLVGAVVALLLLLVVALNHPLATPIFKPSQESISHEANTTLMATDQDFAEINPADLPVITPQP